MTNAVDDTQPSLGQSAAALGLEMCEGCSQWVDPTVCHCGETIVDGVPRAHVNHSPVPMGCNCRRVPA